MRIGFATAHSRRDLHEDDLLLSRAFGQQRIDIVPVVWTEPLQSAGLDAVIVRSCWDYVGDHAAFLAWATNLEAQGIPVLNNVRAMRWNRDKFYLRELSRLGLPTVPTIYSDPGTSIAELAQKVASKGWRDLLLRPAIGHNGFGSVRLKDGDLAEYLSEEICAQDLSAVLVQPGHATPAADAWSVIGFDRQLSHTLRRLPQPGDVRGGMHVRGFPGDEVRQLAYEVLQVIPEHLFARINLQQFDGRFVVTEVEMIAPFLHFGDAPEAAHRFVAVALAQLADAGVGHARSSDDDVSPYAYELLASY